MKFKLLLVTLVSFVLFSCEKECFQERNTLEAVNLKNLRPTGDYILDNFLSNEKITFNAADSTATIKYIENDTTYEFIYNVKTIGTYESEQEKF